MTLLELVALVKAKGIPDDAQIEYIDIANSGPDDIAIRYKAHGHGHA